MLMSAHAGFFIHPPESIVAKFPQFPVTRSYAELKAAIDTAAARAAGLNLQRRSISTSHSVPISTGWCSM